MRASSRSRSALSASASLLVLILATGLARGLPPDEIGGVGFDSRTSMTWAPDTGADFYNIYRGSLAAGADARCHAYRLPGTAFAPEGIPEAGDAFFYLVTGESGAEGEGPQGDDWQGLPRPLLGACTPWMRNHVLNHIGYGWSEWSRDRIESLGIDGYIAEQLNPLGISEFTNIELNTRLASLNNPKNSRELIRQFVIRGVYARRQLEQQLTAFWVNHFNTDWTKVEAYFQEVFPACDEFGQPPQCDPIYPTRAYLEASRAQFKETNEFRALAFNGSFREMVEASALSPAMIIYLDTILSDNLSPNENYPREVMELHTMGVEGGYTQGDVEQLSEVITGWTICKKAPADLGDPLAPCLEEYWDDGVPGGIVATFVPDKHTCTSKTLFAGTPQETEIPDTCADPALGVQDLYTALDAIVAHPSTAPFISRKILERLVTDSPTQEMVDAVVAEWNDATNPHGVGDMRAVLEAVLTLPAFLDPDRVDSKIKTPLEQFVSALRATRGYTDGGIGVIEYLVSAQHLPYLNPTPTGWPEDGPFWIGTNNTLDRQNFALALMDSTLPVFGADPVGLLTGNGISTGAGNDRAIVDFLADAFFGGALSTEDRQAATDFLNTDDAGEPSPYDDARIRDLAAFLLGFPQFQEQ